MATDTKRTKGIHIYTPHDGEYRVEIERETIRTYENGDQVPLRNANVRFDRKLAQIAALPIPGGPVTVTTYSDLAALLAACAENQEQTHLAEVAEVRRRHDEAVAEAAHRLAVRIAEDTARAAIRNPAPGP